MEREYKIDLPDFVSVRDPVDLGKLEVLRLILDPGEASSIILAAEIPGSKIIIDEKKGRRIALSMGLDVTGSVGIIRNAVGKGLIEVDEKFVERLEKEGFRLSTRLKSILLRPD